MAELSATDIGVDLQKLRGQENYTRWSRDFKLIAELKGVWGVISGEEKILPKPSREKYFTSPTLVRQEQEAEKGPKSEDAMSIDQKSSAKETPVAKDHHDLNVRMTEYKLDLEEYERNSKKVRLANALIAYWTDPAIRGKVQTFKEPNDAWNWIQSQYKMQDSRALDICLTRMENLKLANCSSVQDYLNQHEMCKLDIEEVGGTYTASQITSKIIRGLSPQYNAFVDQYHFLHDIDGVHAPSLKNLTSRLLTFESTLRERSQGRNVNAVVQKRDKCTFDGCGKWGHKTENCWVAQPELKNKRDEKCTFDGCGKSGHRIENCWVAHPELKKKRDEDRGRTQRPSRVTAMATVNLEEFQRSLAEAESTSSHLHPAPTPKKENLSKKQEIPNTGRKRQGKRNPQLFDIYEDTQQEETNTLFEHITNVLDAINVEDRRGETDGQNKENIPPQDPSETHVSGSVMMLISNEQSTKHDKWIMDSGANIHIVNDRKWFDNFAQVKSTVGTADDTGTIDIQGGGSVSLTLSLSDGNIVELHLSTVAYAPQLRCNILSLSMLAEAAGLNGIWSNREITINTKDGHLIGTATLTDGLYQLNIECHQTQTTDVTPTNLTLGTPIGVRPQYTVATIDYSDPVWKWHRRMGHLGIDNLRKLLKVSEGMDVTDKQLKAKLGVICPICATTRAIVKIPREPATRRYRRPGELIHADTWGPYPIHGLNGVRYSLVFTDDATRFSWSKLYGRKHELPELFRTLHRKIETTHDIKIRRYRIDNEVNRTKMIEWLERRGVTIEATAPYAHHQNGVAERHHRTERERAAAMLQETTVSSQLSRAI